MFDESSAQSSMKSLSFPETFKKKKEKFISNKPKEINQKLYSTPLTN
jgi:hypothetical protein